MSEEKWSAQRSKLQWAGLVAGPLLALPLLTGPHWGWQFDADRPHAGAMAGVAILMGIWWITEALPMAMTSLLPLVFYPLFSIPPGSAISLRYGDTLIFLFLGGCLLAAAIEQCGLHRRLALSIIALMGNSPERIVLGVMIATYLVSMWISNTATTLMLFPIAMSLLTITEEGAAPGEMSAGRRNFGVTMMLGLAYAANIGGVGTLVGTPTNLVFRGFYQNNFPDRPVIEFGRWMAFATPYSSAFLLLSWAVMAKLLFPMRGVTLAGRNVVREELRALGPMRGEEWRVLAIFLATATLWITREMTPGVGWAAILGLVDEHGKATVDDTAVAIAMAIMCFILPSGRPEGGPILRWEVSRKIPWGVLLLFGGGLALGAGMNATHLDEHLGERMSGVIRGLSATGQTALVATFVTFFSEVTSNIACLTMMLPILKGTFGALAIDPRPAMVVATLAASSGFALPVATGPNAIVYSSGRMRMSDMLKAGLVLDLIGIVLMVIWTLLFSVP